jgi:predicted metal-dependent phosphoesterase TrpH
VTSTFRADLHVHSRYSDSSGHAGVRALRSAESFTDPNELYAAQRARGMDFVTITDHNTLAGSLAIAHLPGTFLSTEFDTWFPEDGVRAHVVALGIDEATFAAADAARANVHDLVACLRAANAAHFLAHPLFDMAERLAPETVERMLLLFNVLEGRNGARTSRCNGLLRAIVEGLTPEQLWAMAERHGIEPYGETPWRKALTGGSDDHSGLFSASAYTVAGGDGTAEGFVRAVAAGECDHGGADGDSRLLAHSIYAASFWRIRELLRLDEAEPQRRAIGLLRKGFGRIGREVPVLEKAVRGVRTMAPGLYRDGDSRGSAWEELLEREIGSLLTGPDGLNAVDVKDLNRRLFVVAQRIADDVTSLHLQPLLARDARLGVKRRLQSAYAVAMVTFLELPYFIAWSFQSRDRDMQAQLRAYFLGERRQALREKVAVLSSPRRAGAAAPSGETGAGAPVGETAAEEAPAGDALAGAPPPSGPLPSRPDISVTLVTCSAGPGPTEPGAFDFRALAWRPSPDGRAPGFLVPPVVEMLDFLDEEGFSALHTDSTGEQGLLALLAARLLHLPLTGAVDPGELTPPELSAGLARRLRRRYRLWFYAQLDEAYAPTPAAARALVAGGVDPEHVTVLAGPATDAGGRAGPD